MNTDVILERSAVMSVSRGGGSDEMPPDKATGINVSVAQPANRNGFIVNLSWNEPRPKSDKNQYSDTKYCNSGPFVLGTGAELADFIDEVFGTSDDDDEGEDDYADE